MYACIAFPLFLYLILSRHVTQTEMQEINQAMQPEYNHFLVKHEPKTVISNRKDMALPPRSNQSPELSTSHGLRVYGESDLHKSYQIRHKSSPRIMQGWFLSRNLNPQISLQQNLPNSRPQEINDSCMTAESTRSSHVLNSSKTLPSETRVHNN